MSRLILRPFAKCILPINQTRLLAPTSSRHLSTFPALREAKHEPYRPPEIDRACGVPQDSPEAGPSSPGGILGPEMWIIGPGVILTMIGLYYFLPTSTSESGHAMQQRILGERQALERRRGDREAGETEEQKAEEAELIAKARAAKAGR